MTKLEYIKQLISKRILTEQFKAILLANLVNSQNVDLWFENFLKEFYVISESREWHRKEFNKIGNE